MAPAVVHPEHNIQIVQVEGAPPGAQPGHYNGSRGGGGRELDQGARPRASPGSSTGEFDWEGWRGGGVGLVWGLYVARTRLFYQEV